MIRRCNYTGRIRIRRRDVRIIAQRDQQETPSFSIVLQLDDYGLPAAAPVFAEAYRQTSFTRFSLGTVGSLGNSQEFVLSGFGAGEGVRFRVKVVESAHAAGDANGRILALADRLNPVWTGAPGGQRGSMLPVEWGEFDDQPWRLEFDEDTQPILRVSRVLVDDRHLFVLSHEFTSLVMPGILRSILTRVMHIDNCTSPDDADGWRKEWLAFATELAGRSTEADDPDDWIEECVSTFCRRMAIASRFRNWHSAGRQ